MILAWAPMKKSGSGMVESLLTHAVVGASWEGFVIENLLVAAPEGAGAFYYRTSGGAEIDLLLERPGSALWAVEVKRSSAPSVSRGFHAACADIRPARRFVVYPGSEAFPLQGEVEALPPSMLMSRLTETAPSMR
jgi:predicted AAA+ superfamily ATPase